MFCTKCGADNLDDDIFCTNCGAVLIGVSLDGPEVEEAPVIDEAKQEPIQPVATEQPVVQPSAEAMPPFQEQTSYTAVEQPAYATVEQPAYAPQEQSTQLRQRKRKKRNPRGIEWLPIGGAILALLFLFLPWFSVFQGLQKWNLVSFLLDLLKGIGSLGFLDFVCIALYLIVIASPIMIAWFAWRRDNNYMGLSLLAIGCAILANIFTRVGIGKGVGFSVGAGFYLYILAIGAAIAGGVMISMQRQKNPRRPRSR